MAAKETQDDIDRHRIAEDLFARAVGSGCGATELDFPQQAETVRKSALNAMRYADIFIEVRKQYPTLQR